MAAKTLTGIQSTRPPPRTSYFGSHWPCNGRGCPVWVAWFDRGCAIGRRAPGSGDGGVVDASAALQNRRASVSGSGGATGRVPRRARAPPQDPAAPWVRARGWRLRRSTSATTTDPRAGRSRSDPERRRLLVRSRSRRSTVVSVGHVALGWQPCLRRRLRKEASSRA